jgi:Glycosyltransferase family 87
VVLWTLVGIATPAFVSKIQHDNRATQEDFAVYYFLGQELRHGINPYATKITRQSRLDGLNIHGITHGTDPPTFLAFLIEPLSGLPLYTAYWIWQAVNLACLCVAIYLLIGPGSGLTLSMGLTLAALAALYPPVGSHIWFGQSKFPALLLLVLMMRSLRRGHEALAGVTLAIASLLRIFPFALVGYLLLQQRWRAIFYTTVGILVGGAATVALMGLDNCVSFVTAAGLLVSDSAADIRRDISIPLFIARQLQAVAAHPSLFLEAASKALIISADTVILMATIQATLASADQQDRDSRIFALWVATAVFLLPVAWDYDLVLMLIPFSQLAIIAARGEASRRAIAMAILSYLLLIWWEYVALSQNECGFFSMLTAYLSAYWLAVDHHDSVRVPLRRMPNEIWRRLTPAT